jgi:hypothetical protein
MILGGSQNVRDMVANTLFSRFEEPFVLYTDKNRQLTETLQRNY